MLYNFVFSRNNLLKIVCHLCTRSYSQSHYDVLKISQSCTSKEIRDAFIHLSKKNHPDRHQNDPSMHEKFVQINEAYSTLINPSKRRAYDLSLYRKRKLNSPETDGYEVRRSTYADSFHRGSSRTHTYERAHSQKRYADYGQYYRNPFTWENESARSTAANKHIRRYSNSAIVVLLVAFSLTGVVFQMLAIKKNFMANQQKMMERSREWGALHLQARENARLHGNAEQIEILKRKLAKAHDDETPKPVEEMKGEGNSENTVPLKTEEIININTNEDEKIEKCARHKENNENSTIFCPKHQRIPVNEAAAKSVCKKCNKKINK